MDNLSHIKIKGFKSIKELDLEMKPINVLIGANGSGKSNFISVFEFLKYAVDDNIEKTELYVKQHGGSDAFLLFGSNITKKINIDINIQKHKYSLGFEVDYNKDVLTSTSIASNLENSYDNFIYFEKDIKSINTYHFHNTGKAVSFKKYQEKNDYAFLRSDAKNIAPFLYHIREKFNQEYRQIVQSIQTVAPYFHDFVLNLVGEKNDERILLRWQHKNDLDNDFSANQLSDGTARFICMATLFLQPKELRPKTIILDEPEIGLHPTAIAVLSEIIQTVANDGAQVIISTQSVELANYFEPDDFIIVDYENGESKFKRLNAQDLGDWIETYQVGEAWSEGLLGGEPKW
ncbi:AAA family ATPase [Bathymodiolus septemdierum thioautotrophic gill symbiont]|uniref:SMC domain protein n=1 Tax=endosymbiont of Bathymodiolus septemdierum str. Myojin knoll TaxID=1303921 RepID=A0A0P0UQ56_9GAMM|nr:AAA family ATPase [Bathymodiolus septemdierum thioautotrophic gill symbiont]BAS67142.1 SMC domain protein [endosymbiont of Bathymodiolus septemdierum str. Myojin knoll]